MLVTELFKTTNEMGLDKREPVTKSNCKTTNGSIVRETKLYFDQ